MKIVFLNGYVVNPGDLSWEALRSLGELQVFERTRETEIVARARDADVLLTMRTPISAETMSQLKRLRYIGVVFTGYDQTDLKAAGERNIDTGSEFIKWGRPNSDTGGEFSQAACVRVAK
ncbi:MAG: hypothetical protein JOZ29_19995 [Deltaproteobacteria bacterium]|nr:hypothetical protein [Deltaproteobacteria bacterium]